MPYSTNQDLSDSVKDVLPEHAQDIFREAFNSAYEEYKDPKNRQSSGGSQEEVAFKVAWSAVKKSYEKRDDDTWHPKK